MSGFSALVAILSLNMSLALIQAEQISGSFPITGATVSTPITITSPNHGVPLGRTVHALVSGVEGEAEANGMWELTPVDPNTFSLATYNPDGTPLLSVGVNAYTSGGIAQYAFADYRILLGRRWIAQSTAVASPRIVFVPSTNRTPWDFFPYGGQGPAPRQSRGSGEQQIQTLQPLQGTKYTTFEVHITGATNPPQPDSGDFDAVAMLEDALFVTMFDAITPPGYSVVASAWVSQTEQSGSMSQRGQKKILWLQIPQPIIRVPAAAFVPEGTSIVFTVQPATDPLIPGDQTVIDVTES
jgi:hypothetical protein